MAQRFASAFLSLSVAAGWLAATAAPSRAGTGGASPDDRQVQIVLVDFATGVIELHNFAQNDVDIGGWRFCTHDDDQVRRYTGPTGLAGGTIVESGTSFFVHTQDDAPAADPDSIDLADLLVGAGDDFALPLDNDAYALELFVSASFESGANMVDHMQWNLGGVGNTFADERSVQAQNAGLWTLAGDWISTAADTEAIDLLMASGGQVLHGPADYDAVPEPSPGLGAVAALAALGWLRRSASATRRVSVSGR